MSNKWIDPYAKEKCIICKEVPQLGFFLAAPELRGKQMICTRCVFEKLTGDLHEWNVVER